MCSDFYPSWATEAPTAAEQADMLAGCHTVVRVGTLMTAAGTGAYRVREVMNRIGVALGFDCIDAEVTLNSVIATCHRDGRMKTLVGTVPAVSVNAGRISAMETLSLSCHPGMDSAAINARLDLIESTPPRYNRWMTSIAAMVACAAFCFLNNGNWVDCLSAATGAGAGQFLRATLASRRLNQLGVALLAALLASIVYLAISGLMMPLGYDRRHDAGYASAVLFLFPGFPLITAALDLARFDFTAGNSRLTYAVLMLTVTAIGAWIVADFAHFTLEVTPPLPLSDSLLLSLRLLAGFLGVFGFASLFNTRAQVATGAAVIGMLANTVRLYLVDIHVPLQAAAPCATLLVGLMAAVLSPRLACPRITLSVPAVLIMIPGTTAYRALVYGNQGLALESFSNASQAVFIVVGITIGLAAARMLTNRVWAFEDQTPGMAFKRRG